MTQATKNANPEPSRLILEASHKHIVVMSLDNVCKEKTALGLFVFFAKGIAKAVGIQQQNVWL